MAEHDEVSGFVSEIRQRDGTTIWISENARAIRDWKGQIVCYQGTVEDVTARFAAERAIKKGLKRAEQANRTKNAFLAMMSHELKTPLNAIIGFSEMVGTEMLGPIGNKAYLGYINDIHASGNKLLAIINDVLDVARFEGNAITLNRCECCAQEIADLALKRARAHSGDSREVVFDIPDRLPTLNVDKLRLAQVLANLLANALKFTPSPGVVTLRAWASGGRLGPFRRLRHWHRHDRGGHRHGVAAVPPGRRLPGAPLRRGGAGFADRSRLDQVAWRRIGHRQRRGPGYHRDGRAAAKLPMAGSAGSRSGLRLSRLPSREAMS
jgi:signal transduction histidine kinase